MPDAFNNGRKHQDTNPYAPKTDGRTPYELAKQNGLLNRWIHAGTPISEPYPTRPNPRTHDG